MKLRDYIEELQQSSLGHTNPVVIELLLAIGFDKLDEEIDQITRETACMMQRDSELTKVQQLFTLIRTHYKEQFPYGGSVDDLENYGVHGDTLTIQYSTWNDWTEECIDDVVIVPSIWLTMDDQTVEKSVNKWFKLKRLHFQLENTEQQMKSSQQCIVNCEQEIDLLREKVLNLEETRLNLLEEIENENENRS